ncbi:uncharacterized protein LOC124456182 [Xenia sp. Carnegie-2017]|uniref:uncharacterized protein LOC124456182 n=1 Tax=Xenia sp. Carnegie-2017 TaxID=2897299 RepID=UPI001F04C63D|nr:uncharacterized protein LOC124456182 [Xenia sp. Carnegie-2017]
METTDDTEDDENLVYNCESVLDDDEYSEPIINTSDNVQKQQKYIVFLKQLLLLFKTCMFFHGKNLVVHVCQSGTMVTIKTMCKNVDCHKEFVWKSQPLMPGTKIAAGNFLLSFAVLVAGSSAIKTFQAMKHMGLQVISLPTYFRHQLNILFPSIFIFWRKYQQKLLKN